MTTAMLVVCTVAVLAMAAFQANGLTYNLDWEAPYSSVQSTAAGSKRINLSGIGKYLFTLTAAMREATAEWLVDGKRVDHDNAVAHLFNTAGLGCGAMQVCVLFTPQSVQRTQCC